MTASRIHEKGFFVTLEGPEGSGKSTQAKRLVAALRRRRMPVVALRDPGSTALGRRLRQVLLHTDLSQLSPVAEALLFIAGRVALIEEQIGPALARGAVVVCDRFHDSTVAYQGGAGGVTVAWLDRLGREAIGGLMPDLTILLDVPAADGLARVRGSRGFADRIERKALAFHNRVRRTYLRLARQDRRRFLVIDARAEAEPIHQRILNAVLARRHRNRP